VLIRKAAFGDAGGIARVHINSWLATYAGVVPDAHLRGLSVERRSNSVKAELTRMESGEEHGAMFVSVTDEGEVTGFIKGLENPGDPPYNGELCALYIDERFKRRGLGTGLTLELVKWLIERGAKGMSCWVFEANAGARRFYERIGGMLLPGTKVFEIGGAKIRGVRYGWDNLAALADRLAPRPREQGGASE